MAKYQRSRTSNIKDGEIDFRVLQFTCHDNTFLSGVGKHCQESRWLLEVAGQSQPVDILVTVDKQVMSAPEVHVTCNSKQVFPASSKDKAKLQEDFSWRWPFRGVVRGLQVPDAYHVRSEYSVRDEWYTATLTQQLDDGLFKAMVKMPAGEGRLKEIEFPAVKAANIREAMSHRPLALPKCELVLHVPFKNPLHPTLCVAKEVPGLNANSEELITHFLARRTPPPPKGTGLATAKAPDQVIKFEVTKDRKSVKASEGYSVLSHFMSGQVRCVDKQVRGKLKKTFKIQIGPFAEHVVELEKKSTSSKIVTLTVDGEILCEATAEDIESREDWWECQFRFMGEKFLDWHVYECNSNGVPLDKKGHLTHRTVYSHMCTVSFVGDVSSATMQIDGVDYVDLPDAKPQTNAEIVDWSPESLNASFGLVVPFKVDPDAPTGLGMGFGAAGGSPGTGGIFDTLFGCCASPTSHVNNSTTTEIS